MAAAGQKPSFIDGDDVPACHFSEDASSVAPPSPVSPSRSASLQHPFAASAKGGWHPPLYEKRIPRSSPTPTLHVGLSLKRPNFYDSDTESESECPYDSTSYQMFPSPVRTKAQIENDIWEDASAKVFDGGHGLVNLEARNLTAIPESFIDDLAKFYTPSKSMEASTSTVRGQPFARGILDRTATVPEMKHNTPATTRLFTRTRSAAEATFGVPRETVQLHLGRNMIATLPPVFFRLQNLSVLSLWNNNIKTIPPEICHLKNLKDLNIANNRIAFLPAEMLQMTLKQLRLFPGNAFRFPGTNGSSFATWPGRVRAGERILPNNKTTLLDQVPSLVEICLRFLLSSPRGSNYPKDTLLSTDYNLPVDEAGFAGIPPHLRRVLKTCIPESISGVGDSPAYNNFSENWWSQVTGIGTCLSSRHDDDRRRPVFIRHAEETFSWETKIADVDVGAFVPVRWRGCCLGCLDFLAEKPGAGDGLKKEPKATVDDSPVDERNSGADLLEDVIQVVQFESGTLDDFDA